MTIVKVVFCKQFKRKGIFIADVFGKGHFLLKNKGCPKCTRHPSEL
ncbi:hypothetical protein PB1_09342 [Bacillus methanolicus PB1]|uniref:Uncharacterized protein n=1 Tax=Bacillus methanolicus PB1 TaxID=997296 RepID=I3E233_BACMT|nr:hypothetical protein PB1_09342 [Bacillus methanolicus PB1]